MNPEKRTSGQTRRVKGLSFRAKLETDNTAGLKRKIKAQEKHIQFLERKVSNFEGKDPKDVITAYSTAREDPEPKLRQRIAELEGELKEYHSFKQQLSAQKGRPAVIQKFAGIA